VKFPIAIDTLRQLGLTIQDIYLSPRAGSGVVSILDSPISSYIDSGRPYIYLPTHICNLVADQLNLTYDAEIDHYLTSNTTHDQLLRDQPSLTFQLAPPLNQSQSVSIKLPYSSLSLLLQFPWVKNNSWYFPIKRATSPKQHVLGRALLQNAYLISDYDREVFSIHNARPSESGMASLIRMILPGNETGTLDSWELDIPKKDSSGSSGTQKNPLGIILASVLVPLCVLVIAYLVFRLKWKTSNVDPPKKADTVEIPKVPELASTSSQTPQEADGIQTAELENLGMIEVPDVEGFFTRVELDSESVAHEMEGSPAVVADSAAKG
jgi:hypothetical protein